jgi:16S rRNA A1518/A1519 N6-dimethyltransferase RsmA/KsgA/DIM1 with predicted DNA glycosylase/AP lyase activity
LLFIINNILQLSNLAIVRGPGRFYKIVRRNLSAAQGNQQVSRSPARNSVGDVTRLIKLRYLSAATAMANIRPFLSRGATMVQNTVTNDLIITDTPRNISKAASILSLLDEPYHLVANLPYYIATNIILKALKDNHCHSVLVMVQKEVADKFAAKVKQKEFSALAVLTNSVGKATVCFEVEPEAFVPPPNVTSAVLLIEKNRTRDDEKFEQFLKISFRQPRKKLSKNLTAVFPKNLVAQLFSKLELNSNLRPHEVETSIYHHIYNELKDYLDGQQSKQRKQKQTSRPKTST